MDFNKLTQQASGLLNKQSGGSSSSSSDPNNSNLNQSTNQTTDPAAQSNATGNTTQQSGSAPQSGMAGTNSNTGDMDYGDKGLAFVEQKTGHTMGRDTNEKITDGARGAFEKFSGKKVDPKYSN